MAKKKELSASELVTQLISKLKQKQNDLQADAADIENEQDALSELIVAFESTHEIL